MKYCVVHVLEGDIRRYHESLAHEISRRFGLKNVNRKIMPHITLKAPFETEEIRSVEDTLCNVLDSSSPFSYDLFSFGSFGREVVCLDIVGDKHLREIAVNLSDSLYEQNGLEIGMFEGRDVHFHSTLAYTNKENFEEVWNYVQRLPKPSFEKRSGSVSILQKESKEKVWDVYKHYRID